MVVSEADLPSSETDIAEVWNNMFKNFRNSKKANVTEFYKDSGHEMKNRLTQTNLNDAKLIE